MPEPNIVLTGFMGTGKTSIGREVAARLGRPFVDVDDLIVQRAGKSVSAIFVEDGEDAFRALEAIACQELRAPAGLVIATGGGAVLDAANREALGAGGVVICLEADPATIVARLAGQDGRPLLAGTDRTARVAGLLAQRAGIYEALPHHLDTTRLTIGAAAERVLAIAAGLSDGGYRLILGDHDILIAEGLLEQAGRLLIAAGLTPGRCAIITNPTVGSRHAPALSASLAAAGFEPRTFEVPDGEAHKTLGSASRLYTEFASARLARAEPVIALGGGVIGDLAGFVAATWLRGVPFAQIPTSLLAMVDASVGGKVAVDLPEGKNLVGAFKQPAVVLIDPGLLSSLPGAEFRAGLAEVVKSALIGDPALFEQLAGTGPASLVSMVADTVRVKASIVARDPFELGDRAWLNLGHTFAHALELVSNYTLRHGEAVALGLIAAASLSGDLGYCEHTLPGRIAALIGRLGLPSHYAFDGAAARAAMATDKKRSGRSLRFVLIKRVGEVVLADNVPEAAIKTALGAIGGV